MYDDVVNSAEKEILEGFEAGARGGAPKHEGAPKGAIYWQGYESGKAARQLAEDTFRENCLREIRKKMREEDLGK